MHKVGPDRQFEVQDLSLVVFCMHDTPFTFKIHDMSCFVYSNKCHSYANALHTHLQHHAINITFWHYWDRLKCSDKGHSVHCNHLTHSGKEVDITNTWNVVHFNVFLVLSFSQIVPVYVYYREADTLILPDSTEEHSGQRSEGDHAFSRQLREGQPAE